jgi:cellulose synthase operon protein C
MRNSSKLESVALAKWPFFGRICVVVLAMMLAVGCGGGGTEASIAAAKEHLVKGDQKAAIIEIKNALQKAPESAEARYMLGSALLESGDAAAAEVELRKALEFKAPQDDVVPKLAKALLMTRQFKKVTDSFADVKLVSPAAIADLQTYLATAFAAQEMTDKAAAALAVALAANPNHELALVTQARQRLVSRQFDVALTMADSILAVHPRSAEAWRLKGDVRIFSGKSPDDAIVEYTKAIDADPRSAISRISLISTLISRGRLEDAAKALDGLRKTSPGNFQTLFFSTQLAYLNKEYKTAREQAQLLLRATPTNPRVLQLAGAVEYQMGSFLQAEVLLNKAVAGAPELVLARRMLISTYLRSGQPSKALVTLNQGIAKGIVDPEINSIAGEVYLQNGDPKKAEEYFTKAAKDAPADPRKRTSLALTKLAATGSDAAMHELQEIAANDKGVTADMALISAHLRKGDYERALSSIDSMEKKQPDKPLAANLRGRTQLAMKDVAGARKSFERALQIDPLFFQATASLAALDLSDKKPEDARKRFEAVLAKEPKHPQALLAMAELAARTGATQGEIGALLLKAAEANPTEAGPKLQLVNFHLASKDYKKATSIAQDAVAAQPENPDLLEALGRVQQAAGESNQAITTFTKLVALQPLSPKPLLRLAEAQVANKTLDAAVQSLKKALEVKPDLIDAQRGLIALNMDLKRPSEAVAVAKTVQKQRPKEHIGYVLEGDVLGAQRNWDGAVAAYRVGLKEAPSSELAIKIHATLGAAGKSAEADKFTATWIKDAPRDAAFQFYLGDHAIGKKDFEGAEKAYEAVVKLQPGNAAAYNNLAWVAGKLKRPNAISWAEKALQLAPEQPSFLDTLAMLQSEANRYDKALELQNKALKINPENALFKLNLARIHIKGGKRDEAKKVLDELAKLGEKFPAQAEVASLLRSL